MDERVLSGIYILVLCLVQDKDYQDFAIMTCIMRKAKRKVQFFTQTEQEVPERNSIKDVWIGVHTRRRAVWMDLPTAYKFSIFFLYLRD